ncbi:NAD-dependent epimerase/dehydratase family protein [Arthrobacter flavus]|uniref:NAD-dependent epimerase/dehydratase family protein n=1 Tax=Arthrobacter flavus TaxID=95172 RepID=A0ABW4Q3M0_9MICC
MIAIRVLTEPPVRDSGAASEVGDGRRVLLIGARGFIGTAVSQQLRASGWLITHLTRHALIPGQGEIAGDLTDLDSLRRACVGHDVVINAASYVGPDAREQHEVNSRGSRHLANAIEGTSVSRLVYISSTSVYGGQVPNGSREQHVGFTPRSTLSASRLEAERITLDTGGVVLRPHLVYGPRDRFFLAPLILAMHSLGGWIERGKARISAISSETLARAVSEVAAHTSMPVAGQVFHAAHPKTVSVEQLVESILRSAGRTAPTRSFSADHAFEVLRSKGVTANQISMVATDNWVDSTRLWERLNVPPAAPLHLTAASHTWYQSQLDRM